MRLHLHLISDSTGETVTTVARAAVSQFEGVEPVEHVWFFVRTEAQLDRIMVIIEGLPGLVLFTLAATEMRLNLETRCRALGMPCVPVLDGPMAAISGLVGAEVRPQVGGQHVMNDGYFTRIEAMQFALKHDDGQSAETLEEADVVLVGVSRTSKTPTCMYLAHRGIKAANVPVVPDLPLPVDLAGLRRPLVVGLTIAPKPLVQIRKSRQRQLGMPAGDRPKLGGRDGGDYADLEHVSKETVHARRLFARHGWPVIDVTRRSVEETAATIYQMVQARHDPDIGGRAPTAP